MLKGQLCIGFVARTAVGFILVVGLAYAVISMNQTLKQRTQEQTLVSTARYVAGQVLTTMEELEENQSMNKTIRLPVFREAATTPYALSFETRDGQVFVKASSMQWQMVSRHPLYLNSTEVQTNTLVSYPPKMCVLLSKNGTYQLNVTC